MFSTCTCRGNCCVCCRRLRVSFLRDIHVASPTVARPLHILVLLPREFKSGINRVIVSKIMIRKTQLSPQTGFAHPKHFMTNSTIRPNAQLQILMNSRASFAVKVIHSMPYSGSARSGTLVPALKALIPSRRRVNSSSSPREDEGATSKSDASESLLLPEPTANEPS